MDADGRNSGRLGLGKVGLLATSVILWAFGPIKKIEYIHVYTICIYFWYQNLGYSNEYPGIPLTLPVLGGRRGQGSARAWARKEKKTC